MQAIKAKDHLERLSGFTPALAQKVPSCTTELYDEASVILIAAGD